MTQTQLHLTKHNRKPIQIDPIDLMTQEEVDHEAMLQEEKEFLASCAVDHKIAHLGAH